MTSASLHSLMQQAENEIQFDAAAYAMLEGASDDEAKLFAIRHLNLHLMQTSGRLAAVCSGAEHGEVLDTKEVAAVVPESLIYVLRLARVAGLTSEQLTAAIDGQYKEWKEMYG
ncbi:MAG: hypothetical protein AB7G06_07330 [Bdellovibrionales bacterium]